MRRQPIAPRLRTEFKAKPRPAPAPLDVFALAATAVRKADLQHPADQVLRETLKTTKALSRGDGLQAADALFAYFRWRGWLREDQPLPARIEEAVRLAERFAAEPQGFSEEELLQRAVPSWTAAEVDIQPGWLRTLQNKPKLWLRARAGQAPGLARQLGDCALFNASSDAVEYSGHEDLFRRPEFHAGRFEVQDLSSQAVGQICAPRAGEVWWDACAGEGGKLLHLSDLMGNKGLIWASDRAMWRLQTLKRRAGRAGVFNYRSASWDGGPKLPTRTRFDGVLVDAPCSGVGTWQRNPHARWTTTPQDIAELATVQEQLLVRAAAAIKPGGRLVYAVCTLTRAETTGVADAFAGALPDFEPRSVANPLDPSAQPGSRLFLWPQRFGGNGMFIAVWQRR